jgi:hypothetical protein
MKKRAADLSNSMKTHQLRDDFESKLAKAGKHRLTLNQPVTGSSPVRLTTLQQSKRSISLQHEAHYPVLLRANTSILCAQVFRNGEKFISTDG